MKKKVELEYTVNTSPRILYNRLSTPSGLSEWFADDVLLQGKKLTFKWSNTEEQAEIIDSKRIEFIRFRWLEEQDEHYFEFKIQEDELTGDVALFVTDFALQEEVEETIELWDQQIADLKHSLGL